MLEAILETYRRSDYDFRVSAAPDDPLSEWFPQWVPYYRLKFAIARTLQPASILEIGVRFGYGAAAFLAGAPAASYLGIDLDSESFGGSPGAIRWARQILRGTKHEIVLGDSQKMDRFPGGSYDLIHVDGQQDGDGTYNDLSKALRQARYILVDGYFWSSANLNAASHFMREHQDEIAFAAVIPGYAGELLIKTRALPPSAAEAGSSGTRRLCDRAYYLTHCGGWDTFRENRLIDPRLATILDLSSLTSPTHLLDLGCGRGEIAAAASNTCAVTAVDASPDAIALARDRVARCGRPETVELHCADATAFLTRHPVDVAVAADLIEHLAPAEVDRLYAQIAPQLTPDGRLIVHTSPSRWRDVYAYPRQRRAASALGAYLPPEPRSRLERAMIINPQSPRVLRDQLQRYFRHVLVWLGTPENPGGSLLEKYGHRRAMSEHEVYAIASHQPVDRGAVSALFEAPALTEADVAGIRLVGDTTPLQLTPQSENLVSLTLHNDSGRLLSSHGRNPVRLAYHWVDADTKAIVLQDGERSRLAPCSLPASAHRHRAAFKAPPREGNFLLQMTLVQEHVRWFDWTNPAARVEIPVAVRAAKV